jgi:hypothetical protein
MNPQTPAGETGGRTPFVDGAKYIVGAISWHGSGESRRDDPPQLDIVTAAHEGPETHKPPMNERRRTRWQPWSESDGA